MDHRRDAPATAPAPATMTANPEQSRCGGEYIRQSDTMYGGNMLDMVPHIAALRGTLVIVCSKYLQLHVAALTWSPHSHQQGAAGH